MSINGDYEETCYNMAKRRHKQSSSKQKKLPKPRRKPDTVFLLEYEITYEPIEDAEQNRLPADVQEQIQELHSLIRTKPREAIPELVGLIERYPNIKIFYNFLAVAYSGIGQQEKSKEVILENLRRHPDYLFARLNYAEICLNEGRLEEVAKILEHKFDLKLLYPQRNRFHVSELVSFGMIVGSYFAAKGEFEIAERYFNILKQVDPEHPMTAGLRSRIDHAEAVQFLKQAKDRMFSMFHRRRRQKPDSED